MPRTTVFGVYDDCLRRPGAGRRSFGRYRRHSRRARRTVAHRRRSARSRRRRASTGRSCSAATIGRASCWPARRADLCQSLRRRCRAQRRGVLRQRRRRMDGGHSTPPMRVEVAAIVDRATSPRRLASTARNHAGCASVLGGEVGGHPRQGAVRHRRSRRWQARAAARWMASADVGWLFAQCCTSHATMAAGRVWNDASGDIRARRAARRHDASPAPPTAPMRLTACLADGARARAPQRRASSDFAPARAGCPRSSGRHSALHAVLACANARRARPSSISRTTSPPRTSRSPSKRRIPLGRASEALHDARHGDRPGQDRPTSTASRSSPRLPARRSRKPASTMFRPPYAPVAIGAFAGHHRGKDFRPARLTPTHALGEGAGRRLRRDRTVAARAIFPAPGRDGLARRRSTAK